MSASAAQQLAPHTLTVKPSGSYVWRVICIFDRTEMAEFRVTVVQGKVKHTVACPEDGTFLVLKQRVQVGLCIVDDDDYHGFPLLFDEPISCLGHVSYSVLRE